MQLKPKNASGQHIEIKYVDIEEIFPNPDNSKLHPADQVDQIVESYISFGNVIPIIIDEKKVMIAGHGRYLAAKKLGLTTIPCIQLTGLTDRQKIGLALADNKIGENGSLDQDKLNKQIALIFSDAEDLEFSIEATGFSLEEVEVRLDVAEQQACSTSLPGRSDQLPDNREDESAVSKCGDLWRLGSHTILCADAREPSSYVKVMGDGKADAVITDSPYNLQIRGTVSGNGRSTHREFVHGSGEMTEAEFIAFLITAFTWMAAYVKRGGLAYLFCDWRHIFEFVSAGRATFAELKNICIWDKQVGGMGSFYRSQHEMILLFKAHKGRHRNNIMLGKHGRSRSNIWSLPGLNSFGAGRDEALAMHPTVKPAKLIADIILDCTSRRGIVLDPFAGSGTILIAAEMTGRIARAIELDEAYVDVAVRRWEAYTGKNAVLAGTGQTFDQVSAERDPAAVTVAARVAD